jgi:hypothetical protein
MIACPRRKRNPLGFSADTNPKYIAAAALATAA